VITILRRTWAKMSPRAAHEAALGADHGARGAQAFVEKRSAVVDLTLSLCHHAGFGGVLPTTRILARWDEKPSGSSVYLRTRRDVLSMRWLRRQRAARSISCSSEAELPDFTRHIQQHQRRWVVMLDRHKARRRATRSASTSISGFNRGETSPGVFGASKRSFESNRDLVSF